MKKVIFLFVTVCLLLSSCSKEESLDVAQLVGTWQVTSINTDDGYFESWNYTFVFGSDGKLEMRLGNGSQQISGYYNTEGDKLVLYGADKNAAMMVLRIRNLKAKDCDFVIESCPWSSQHPLPTLHVVKK